VELCTAFILNIAKIMQQHFWLSCHTDVMMTFNISYCTQISLTVQCHNGNGKIKHTVVCYTVVFINFGDVKNMVTKQRL